MTKLVQRRRTSGTILPVENVQLYRRMVASHEEEKKRKRGWAGS
jgi:hypothetical protein